VGTAGSAGSAGSGGAGSHFGPLEIANALESYYPRLKGLVRAQMSRLAGGGVDQFTESATVHTDDLCMELLNQRQPFRDAEHMMAVASIRCTQLVVDYLRRRSRRKRGGGRRGGALPTELVDDRAGPAQWLLRDGVAEALTRYTEEFPRQAQTLMLRAFFGQATAQIAEILGTSTATVERDLRLARAYFRSLMADDLEEPDERASDAT
jgi:DNA-directed RNA polymerase specialized sigma24 family protein